MNILYRTIHCTRCGEDEFQKFYIVGEEKMTDCETVFGCKNCHKINIFKKIQSIIKKYVNIHF